MAVFGLGSSGIAAARSLIAGGGDVVCWDDGEEARARAHAEGLQLADLKETDWSSLASLILAPGVPLTHPVPHWTVGLAQSHGVEIIGDIEIFAREREARCSSAPFLAITGTNGKSTTTALIAHLLSQLGQNVEMGGNIGRAILSLEPPAPNRIHVVEMSSFQIDLTPTLKPTVGLLLNISPDHIDRHGTLAHYAEIKERLLKEATACAVGIDDPLTRKVAERVVPERLYAFTAGKGADLVPHLYPIGQTLFVHERAGAYATSKEIADLEGIGSLRGHHNVQNALGALATLRALQHLADTGAADLTACDANGEPTIWRPRQLAEGLRSFAGLPHRMEEIGRLGKVLFINDSKATNAEAAEKALSCFKDGIYWLAGGRAKAGGIAALEACFPRIAKAYLFGEAEEQFAASLEGKVSYERCGTLVAATARAFADAASSGASEPVVLFSPACASFDQFRNFEVRGDAFRNKVKSLPGIALKEASQ